MTGSRGASDDERLTPSGAVGDPVDAADLVAGLDLRSRAQGRPHVVAAMIASIDGRVAVGGRAAPLGHPSDRALLRSLRAAVDVVLVGHATIAAERYANLIDAGPRAERAAAGHPSLPAVATISRSGTVPWDVGLFDEPEGRIVVFSDAGVQPPPTVAQVTVVETVSPAAALAHLHDELGARAVLTEGGPRMLRALLADDLVDELFLTVAPMVAAGTEPTLVEGLAFDAPRTLALADVHRGGDHLVLRYVRP